MKAFFTDNELLAWVKTGQRAYFLRLTQGNYDSDYVEDRLKIGAVHEQIDLPIKYYLSMYNFYLCEVWKHIFEVGRTHPDETIETFFSLIKLTFLDSRERTIKARQQQAIRELSTPVLPFREGMLLLPIIGQAMQDGFPPRGVWGWVCQGRDG